MEEKYHSPQAVFVLLPSFLLRSFSYFFMLGEGRQPQCFVDLNKKQLDKPSMELADKVKVRKSQQK